MFSDDSRLVHVVQSELELMILLSTWITEIYQTSQTQKVLDTWIFVPPWNNISQLYNLFSILAIWFVIDWTLKFIFRFGYIWFINDYAILFNMLTFSESFLLTEISSFSSLLLNYITIWNLGYSTNLNW